MRHLKIIEKCYGDTKLGGQIESAIEKSNKKSYESCRMCPS